MDRCLTGLHIEVVRGSGVALGVVGDQKAAIESTLERAKNAGTSGCGGQSNIKTYSERVLVVVSEVDLEILAINLLLACVDLIETQLLERATSKE